MTLFNIIIAIIFAWFIYKIRRFILGIHVTSNKVENNQQKTRRKNNMDIQDADYEDVE